jgi:CheY-like chemotaxis protein
MCHVLIIEDEPLIAMTIQDLLQDEGARRST